MNDLRLAFRLFRRHPVLSGAAVLSLALGIGANAAIFTVLHGSILRPLPYVAPDRLMVVWETRDDNMRRSVAPANFLDWRRELAGEFDALAAFDEFSATLTGHGEAQRVRAVSASANIFELLGVQAQVGRVMTAAEDRPGASPVAVLSDGLWHRLYGGGRLPSQAFILNDIPYTIVGVLPAGFDLPMASGAEVWTSGDRGVPRSFPFPGDVTAIRDSHIISVVGRLADGVSREQAQARAMAVMNNLAAQYPSTNATLGANVVPMHEEVVGDVRPLVLLLQIAVAALLLIACVNVAHLLLGQAAGRQAEMSMRVALGAGRGRLVRQLLVETLFIAIPGGVAGLALAAVGVRALLAVAPATLPRLAEISLDPTVLVFTAATTLATALIFGLGPALQTSRTSAGALTAITQRAVGSRRGGRGRQALVVAELALAQILLVGAGLLLVSFVEASRVDLGFATENRVATELNLVPDYLASIDDDGRIDPGRKIRFINAVIEQVQRAPGVHAVAAASTAPLTGAPNRGIRIEGDPPSAPGREPNADFQIVTSDFFRTHGIRLITGRGLADTDRAASPPVVVISQSLANSYFAGRDPIGRVLIFGGDKRHEVVGIVADARFRSVEHAADPTFYIPLEQNDERWPFLTFTVWTDVRRTDGRRGGPLDPPEPAAILRAAIADVDPLQPVSRIRAFDEILGAAMAARRFNTWIVVLFAATALLLAAIGTYGVMAHAVSSRTRELGVRAALGATPGDLIRMVLTQGLLLTLCATAIGLGAALVLTRFMASFLFGVAPRDPVTFIAVGLSLAAVAVLATLVPTRRAMRVNPVVALREG